jgi:hypothetical protein
VCVCVHVAGISASSTNGSIKHTDQSRTPRVQPAEVRHLPHTLHRLRAPRTSSYHRVRHTHTHTHTPRTYTHAHTLFIGRFAIGSGYTYISSICRTPDPAKSAGITRTPHTHVRTHAASGRSAPRSQARQRTDQSPHLDIHARTLRVGRGRRAVSFGVGSLDPQQVVIASLKNDIIRLVILFDFELGQSTAL